MKEPWVKTLLIVNAVLLAVMLWLAGSMSTHHLALSSYQVELIDMKEEVRTIRKRQDWIYPAEHEDVLRAIQELIDATDSPE